MSHTDGFGLREKQHDGTEFNVGAFINLPSLSTLPEEYCIAIPEEWIFAQRDDTCAKEAISNLLAHVNNHRIEGLLTWVVARANNGYGVEDWGVDLKSIVMSAVKMGALNYEDSPYHDESDRSVYANIANWDLKALQIKAIENKAGSGVEVQGAMGMDYFDTIKATIFKLKTPVMIGVRWNWDSKNPNIDTHSDTGFGHALLVVGWTKDRLTVLNSWGPLVGDGGYFYFSREVINHDIATFGAWTIIDEDPQKIKWMLDNGIYLDDGNWLLNMAKSLILAIKQALKLTVEVPKKTGVPPYPIKIVKMAEAIRQHEGWYPGTRSRRNHNPGNFKFCGQYKAIGQDSKGFAIFPDDETGWNYLLQTIHNACSGKSLIYPSSLTLYEYFVKYAPSFDSNDPKHYAEVVAEYIGCSPFIQLAELLV